jgi:hypothetical protein
VEASAGPVARPPLALSFVPDLAEHLRARREMARLGNLFDLYGRLPWIIALTILCNLMIAVGWVDRISVMVPLGLAMFFLGVGIQLRRPERARVTWVVSESGIEVRHLRGVLRLAWERVERVAETEEFFLVAARRVTAYFPRRALNADAEAALRGHLRERVTAFSRLSEQAPAYVGWN